MHAWLLFRTWSYQMFYLLFSLFWSSFLQFYFWFPTRIEQTNLNLIKTTLHSKSAIFGAHSERFTYHFRDVITITFLSWSSLNSLIVCSPQFSWVYLGTLKMDIDKILYKLCFFFFRHPRYHPTFRLIHSGHWSSLLSLFTCFFPTNGFKWEGREQFFQSM